MTWDQSPRIDNTGNNRRTKDMDSSKHKTHGSQAIQDEFIMCVLMVQQGRQCMYNITVKHIHISTIAMQKP
jgi:hypothetical protein